MNKINKFLMICAVAIGLGAVGMGTAISAPPADQPEWGCGYGPGYGQGAGRKWDSAQAGERMRQHITQRHAALHDKLKLNPQQETAWQAYTAETQKNMTPPSWNREEMAKLSAPERMEKMIQNMNDRQQRMTAQLSALKTFYATLTPEQQKIFDAEWAGRPRQGRMGRGARAGSNGSKAGPM